VKWSGITTSAVHNIAYFPGDHSFLNDFSKEIFGRVQLEVRSAVSMRNVLTAAAPVLAAKSHVHRVRWTKLGQTQLRESADRREDTFVTTLGAEPASDVVAQLRGGVKELILVSTSEEGGIEQNELQAWNFMQLVQEIVGAGMALDISLILPASTQRAMVAGVSKSVTLEFPEIKCRRIFVSPEDIRIAPNWAETILNAVPAEETDIWLQRTRGSRWTVYAQRLTHCPILSNVPPSRPCHFTPGEKIIFTGGTGALGTALVDWLVDQQNVDPADIVLLSRSERTHPRGARIVVTDVSSRDALLENEALSGLDNVSAVFHLAGVLDDGLVTGMTHDRLQRVVDPKARAADGLLALAEKNQWSLRFFLNFSSTSSLLGYAGQSNYCAANTFLDALATWGSSLDCPILTINWGPWGEVGMAKKGTRAYELAVKDGDNPLSNRRALGALAAIINRFEEGAVRGGGEEYAVCDVTWDRSCWRDMPAIKFLQEKQAQIPRRRSSRSRHGSKSPMSIATPQTTRKKSSPKTKSTGKSGGKVEQFLGGLVPRWMPAKSLTALGVDSLDRVQMRGQFNREFGTVAPLALFMKPNQTLGDLANSLSGLL